MENSKVKTLTAANWQAEVLEAKSLVLVDFWAEWCGPCRMMTPVVEELAADYQGKIVVGKLNTDEQSVIAQQYGIMSIPTLILFKGGKGIKTSVGFRSKDDLKKMIDANL